MRSWLSVLITDAESKKVFDIPIAPSLYSLSNKMDNSLLAVRDINHKYIVVESMYRLAYTIVENDADAQDAVGDAIVKAFGNIQRLRKKTSAKSWLMQILVNSAHDIVRKRSKWKIVEKQLDDTAVTEAFESDEMLPIVMELKEEFREIIILYYYEEFSVGEISRMLKIPTGTVKSRLARGRDKLSTIL